VRAVKKIYLTAIIGLVGLIVFSFAAYKYLLYLKTLTAAQYNQKHESAKIVIKRGDNLMRIAQYLIDNRIIVSKSFFMGYAKYKGYAKRFKAGEYFFTNDLTYLQIMKILMKGGNVFYRITIPEGLTLNEIAYLLEKKTAENIYFKASLFLRLCEENTHIVSDIAGAQVNSLEGFIFPETYTYTKDDSESTFFKMIIERFKEKTSKLRNTPLPEQLSFYEVLTLASIVQREAAYVDEMPIIAGVYLNRLHKKMKLEADPTILYAMGYSKNRLLYRDLRRDSPYNTYLYPGLPPTPICNPGFDAIYSTMNPQSHNYLFFVADTNFRHQFSATGKEHERKRLKIKAKRKELDRNKEEEEL